MRGHVPWSDSYLSLEKSQTTLGIFLLFPKGVWFVFLECVVSKGTCACEVQHLISELQLCFYAR